MKDEIRYNIDVGGDIIGESCGTLIVEFCGTCGALIVEFVEFCQNTGYLKFVKICLKRLKRLIRLNMTNMSK